MTTEQNNSGHSYNIVADEYVRRIFHVDHKPFDRALLNRFSGYIRNGRTVADIGCGPGHIGRYLHERGITICGLDISAQMIENARCLNPGIEFIHGDMQTLPVPDKSWASIISFYSIIHIPPGRMMDTLREFARVLEPGSPLLLSFHIGEEVIRLEEWWEQKVSLDFFLFRPDEMHRWLVKVGFVVDEVLEREPYAPEIEHQSRRCYIIARKPAYEK